ncbi:uncharacterized protein MYCGRDRAFT_92064 [Zymoseptoria tritici IPO323]|uniref:DUF7918 domain-containing protein n=1 Tax=Zymoseptoria tritici (strain CBS 115943 / IPO323) TaxID=336722 RepID=F9X6F3_ZYMTI|nr:uncharacterized protein MYCGRDRAFT_92064 [Zymoseptoria tritici IPO323]EGP89030.1 hypothetical protein MYCGRDRAFT_92064 [Zymoseptoria tritici IPO323]
MLHPTGVEVNLLAGGVRMQEYDSAADSDMLEERMCKYVEAVEDTTFEVEVHVPFGTALSSKDCIICKIHLDGKSMWHPILELTDGGLRKPRKCEGRHFNTAEGPWIEKFAFGKLQTTDEASIRKKPDDFKDLGTIKVTCSWGRMVSNIVPSAMKSSKAHVETAIPENRLQPAAPRRDLAVTADTSYPYGKEAFATFQFLYRSQADLQVEGIIEKTPDPIPLEDRDPASLTESEARELLEQFRASKAKQAVRVKQEKRDRSPHMDDNVGDGDDLQVVGSGNSKRPLEWKMSAR